MDTFGNYVAKRRAELGLSQDQVAKAISLSKSVISKIENDQSRDIRVPTLIGLSCALKLHPIKLILAYQGKNPNVDPSVPELNQEMLDLLRDFVSKLPEKVILDALEQRLTDPVGRKRFADKLCNPEA